MAKKPNQNVGIHWFRRDLRVAGNPGLKYNCQESKGFTLGLFCFDDKFLSRPDFGCNRFQFFLETLMSLKKELQNLGGDLLVLNEDPEKGFKNILKHFDSLDNYKLNLVSWNRDYEPFARQRDSKIKDILNDKEINNKNFRDHLIIEPHELVKNGSNTDGYQVYSPFARKWMEHITEDNDIMSRVQKANLGLDYVERVRSNKKIEKVFKLKWANIFDSKSKDFKDSLDDFSKKNKKNVNIEIPKSGTAEAFERLDDFKKVIKDYADNRDIPSLNGTSRLSMFLKNGSITTAQAISYLNLVPYEKKPQTDMQKFYSELVWREFYYHILYRNPEVEKESFNSKYKKLKWQNNKIWFDAWKTGQTGFPIVDAGMRELNKTGWMHNRVRMIVASFLTKDLHIDWRWGEKYFMETLLDGDLAPNNGGWQWAASTGCDPQPYFRIFNPWSQSKKFDPDAKYIKEYIPELKDTDPKNIHDESAERSDKYPSPIVDHSEQRKKALEMFKSV